MRVGAIDALTTADVGGKIGASIFFQGCSRGCPGCHNPELQPPLGGVEMTVEEILNEIKKHTDWYEAVALVGGEPLEQDHGDIFSLLRGLNSLGLETWLYTGYELEDIPQQVRDLCTVIVAGPYVESLATQGFPASSNQQVVDRRMAK